MWLARTFQYKWIIMSKNVNDSLRSHFQLKTFHRINQLRQWKNARFRRERIGCQRDESPNTFLPAPQASRSCFKSLNCSSPESYFSLDFLLLVLQPIFILMFSLSFLLPYHFLLRHNASDWLPLCKRAEDVLEEGPCSDLSTSGGTQCPKMSLNIWLLSLDGRD